MLTFEDIKRNYSVDTLLCILLPILFFVTPLSSSAKSILISITVAVIITSPHHRRELVALFANPWYRTLPLLLLIALLGCLWSPASLSEKGLVLEKWSKLLYLPILIVAFQSEKTRRYSLQAFMAAMLLTCMVSLFILYTHDPETAKMDADGVFRNHIMTGMMMSFATYLAGLFFFREQGIMRVVYFVLGLLFSYQVLFINQGRMGYVLYFLLIGLLITQVFNRRQMLAGFLSLGVIFSSCYLLSDTMQNGMHLIVDNVRSYEHNQDKNTSIGYRLQFHDYAHDLFKLHPIIGNGTGSFTYLFSVENPVPAWRLNPEHSGRLLEPHSQYWLVAAEFGCLGLLSLALFYIGLCVTSYRLNAMRPIACALLLLFAVGNLSDSLLFYSGSGYFFILFLALCFSEGRACYAV